MKNKYEKSILTLLTISLTGLGLAQVGIETETPTETLDVNGNMRVESLPLDGEKDAIYTNADGTRAETAQTFTPTRTVVADKNGVLGSVEYLPSSQTDIQSQTACYASTTRNFSEAEADNGVATVTVGDFSFQYDPTTTSGTSNYFRVLNNSATTYYGMSKGNDAYSTYVTLPANEWRRLSDNVNYDTEKSGEILFFTDVEATETPNSEPHFYSVKYFTQKRTSDSFPSVCINVTQLN